MIFPGKRFPGNIPRKDNPGGIFPGKSYISCTCAARTTTTTTTTTSTTRDAASQPASQASRQATRQATRQAAGDKSPATTYPSKLWAASFPTSVELAEYSICVRATGRFKIEFFQLSTDSEKWQMKTFFRNNLFKLFFNFHFRREAKRNFIFQKSFFFHRKVLIFKKVQLFSWFTWFSGGNDTPAPWKRRVDLDLGWLPKL